MPKYSEKFKGGLLRLRAGILHLLRGADNWVSDRVGPVRVIFVVRNEIGFVNQAPVLREMLKFPEFLVCTTSDGDAPEFNFSDPELQSLYDAHEIPPRRAILMKWHYLFGTDVLSLYFRRNALHVEMGHGCGFGNLYREEDWFTKQIMQPSTNLIFGPSQRLKEYVETTYPQAFDPTHRLFFPTGFSKLDQLINGAYSRRQTHEELGLDPARKTILITSHWNQFDMLRRYGSKVLTALLPLQSRYNIILTAHPRLWELPETADFSSSGLWRTLKAIEAQEAHVKVVNSGNAMPLLNAADLLISGNSSIRIEFSILDRPVLFYKPPGHNFTSSRVQELYEKGSYPFSDLEALPVLAAKALENPAALHENQQILKEYFLARPGKSAAFSAGLIRKIGRVSSPRSRNWQRAVKLSQNPD